MSKRTAQIESTLKRAVAQILERQISDPRIKGMVSITSVKVSPDLHDAYVWISVLPEKFSSTTIGGLKHATKRIQTLTRDLVDMRYVPRLEFRLDDSLKKQQAVEDAIKEGLVRSEVETK